MMELGPQSHSQGGLLVRGSIYGPSGVYTSTQKRERQREREGVGGGDYFNARVYASKCSKSWFAF